MGPNEVNHRPANSIGLSVVAAIQPGRGRCVYQAPAAVGNVDGAATLYIR
jgi:hypothetical protein